MTVHGEEPGRRDVARALRTFRRSYLRSFWWDCDGLSGVMALALRVLFRPLRCGLDAAAGVRTRGRTARADDGVGLVLQWYRAWWLRLRFNIPPESFYAYRLYRKRKRADAYAFLHVDEQHRVLTTLMSLESPVTAETLQKKDSFDAWCTANRLPTARMIARFEGGRILHSERIPERDLFAKPTDGKWGIGARRWRYVPPEFRTRAGRQVDPERILELLARASRRTGYVLQECLSNHGSLAALSAGGLCTARIVTGLSPDNRPEVLCCAFRMPGSGEAIVDNFHAGGLVAPISDDGRLGAALFKDILHGSGSMAQHPVTGGKIEGVSLPCWNEAISLVLRAHAAACNISFVGWDVAITDEGPVLLEANPSFGVDVLQVAHGAPLGHSRFIILVAARLEAARRRVVRRAADGL